MATILHTLLDVGVQRDVGRAANESDGFVAPTDRHPHAATRATLPCSPLCPPGQQAVDQERNARQPRFFRGGNDHLVNSHAIGQRLARLQNRTTDFVIRCRLGYDGKKAGTQLSKNAQIFLKYCLTMCSAGALMGTHLLGSASLQDCSYCSELAMYSKGDSMLHLSQHLMVRFFPWGLERGLTPFLCLTVLLAGMLVSAETWGGEKNKPRRDKETIRPDPYKGKTPLQVLVESQSRFVVRKNGVLLRGTLETKKGEKGQLVLLNWTLDYDGPRPFVPIFKPSFEFYALGQCHLTCYAFDEGGEGHGFALDPDVSHLDATYVAFNIGSPQKSSFTNLEKDKVTRGVIEIPLSRILDTARKRYAKQFAKAVPTNLLVQLRYRPSARGEPYNLDAWTGELQTDMLEIPHASFK